MRSIERWKELLRIPSIGTDPAHRSDTRRAADWLVDQLQALGFDAAARDTPGQPIVVGHHPGPDGAAAPRVLYYGHYDVQPPDPLDLWDSPPFEPTIVEAAHGPRMVARGAVDDKGQLMTWLEALRAWHGVHGTLPLAVSVFIEGEEESGSPSLEPFLESHRDELRADVCVVSDTNMWNIDTPALATLLRGLLYIEITLFGPAHDLHSGLYGGAVPNPLNVLTRILGAAARRRRAGAGAGLLRRRRGAGGGRAAAPGRAAVRRGGVPRQRRARPCRPARRAARRSSASGRARPATSTASGAATPAPAPRP